MDQAARDLGFANPDLLRVRGSDLQILEYFRLKHGGFAPLNYWLASECLPPEEALRSAPIHRELAAMDQCSIFYTTNFDMLLERAFALHGRTHTVIAHEEHMATKPEGCQIVKFHGDLNHPDYMVVSESQYEERLKFASPMDYKIRGDLLGRVVLFLGYSFRDSNVSYLFRLLQEHLKRFPGIGSGRRAYITVSDPSAFEVRLFQERNIEVIPIGSTDPTADISTLLATIRT